MTDRGSRRPAAAELTDYRAAAWAGAPPVAAAPGPDADWRCWWWTAIAWSGVGHYARAQAALARARRAAPMGAPVPAALVAATTGSLHRQRGRHDRGAVADGYALARVGIVGPEPVSVAVLAARADALTGLAADLLGRADAAGAELLLARIDRLLAAGIDPGLPIDDSADTGPVVEGDPLWRARLRRHWVGAETAMVAADAETALEHAHAAAAIVAAGPSPRHRIKTELIGGAAAAVAGQTDLAAAAADRVREQARAHGLLPLQWAALALLEATAPTPGGVTEKQECERLLGERGGVMS